MALTKNVSVEFHGKSVAFDNAYIKVISVSGNKTKMTAIVESFDAKDGTKFNGQMVIFDHDIYGGNAIKQTYDHLKTLPEFAGATDC
jgi:hypothetical protein